MGAAVSSVSHCGICRSPGRLLASVSFMDAHLSDELVDACRSLINQRFPEGGHAGAAAMRLGDGTVLTGTAPDAINPSVCLHRQPGGRVVVLSPCGVCRERLAVHGPQVKVAVADPRDATVIVWKPLKDVLPDYWMSAFPDEVDQGWLT